MDTTMLQLRSFIHGRLHRAAEEILGEVEKTITFALYEAEASRSKEEIVSLRHQLGRLREKSAAELSLMSGNLEHRNRAETPLPQENPTEENLSLTTEVPPPSQTSEDLEKNSWNSCVVKTEFKMSDIKEEQEEIDWPSLEIVADNQDESEQGNIKQDQFEDDQLEQHQFEDNQLEQHQSEIEVSFDIESVSSDHLAAQSDSDEELMKNIEAWTKDLESVRRRDRTFCHVCGKQLPDYYSLMKHINLHERTVDCTVCGVELPCTEELLRHMKRSHKKSYSCPICGKRFSSSHLLQIHNKTHRVNDKYVCHECGRTFLCHINLTVHIMTHNREKPFRCDICAKAFSKSRSLAYHKRSHSGEKLFSCALCDRHYTTCAELKKHIKQHSGKKLHSCNICHAYFYTSEQARNHKAKHK